MAMFSPFAAKSILQTTQLTRQDYSVHMTVIKSVQCTTMQCAE